MSATTREQQPFWHGMVAGGSSGVISRLFTYPPDTVKSRLQVQGASGSAVQYAGTSDAFTKIFRREGVPGFYRGFGAILLTVVPANMCYFSGYELGKRITPRTWGTASDLVTATIAQTVAGVAFCPIDIVKQRVQTASVLGTMPAAAPSPEASSISSRAAKQPRNRPQKPWSAGSSMRITPVQAAREVWTHQGLAGFYRGYWAMNALWMPWNLIYLTMYEASKRRIYYWQLQQAAAGSAPKAGGAAKEGIALVADLPPAHVLPVWAFPLCSSTCAAVAAMATHPIDVVKTRLQVLSTAHSDRRWSTAGVARELYASEGAAGFMRGLGARVATLSVGSTISWCVYELVKRHLGMEQAAGEG